MKSDYNRKKPLQISEAHPSNAQLLLSLRIWLGIFILGLVLSGLTAFPLQAELHWTLDIASRLHLSPRSQLMIWITQVNQALTVTGRQFPFLAYGTDWLAFGHLVIALAFLGAWHDPVRNKWLFSFGLLACGGVLPLARIAGALRGIPLYWRAIDCSFGILGAIPLLICIHYVARIEFNLRKR